ncbi:Amt family ammonium transporter [Actinomadura pelletieri DSM 43383]|uniref:Ammonium transporter n=1 Tax=Actinomadura pelletieri DSM 43383 TaxID=1120940 RepID=A0A495QPZ1_9ACTN|nr:ammonium transporter [Actinomadura pelletieri]RKS75027.1 Amt family ammonium transporter [Actinomadura pelletieri DSM 43383]
MKIDSGSTAWMLTSTALVLLMTPGLAFFYGGMSRAKSVLNMMMMSFVSIAVVGMAWVVYGYSLTFGDGGGLSSFIGGFGDWGLLGLEDAATAGDGTGVPQLVFVAFQATFAIITVALISGAIADRAKFGAWVLFALVWMTLVYVPVAHWVWWSDGDDAGWLFDLGALDFAGGTVVHINAGAAALALVLVLGRRKGWPKEPMRPHNLPFVLLGAGLLWFGWFGFNAGSALSSGATAAVAFVNTLAATCAAAFAWIVVEKLRDGSSTTLGIASGIVAGLVAVTPACAFVTPLGAIGLGLVAGAVCAFAVGLKYRLGYDDSLDVVGVHMVGGIVGALLIGVLATTSVNDAGADGLLTGGGFALLGKQAVAVLATLAYSFTVTYVIAKVIDLVMGFRIDADDEAAGIDSTAHAETAYDFGAIRAGIGSGATAAVPAPATKVEAQP